MDASLRKLKLAANAIRRDIVDIAYYAQGPSHPGPALSCTEIVTALYYRVMKINPEKPDWEERDRFILSKGHACPALYAALAERGYFSKDWLRTVRCLGSRLQGHPDMKKTPGVDMTSGSLGNGLSIGLGMALFLKRQYKRPPQIFVLLGDGESQEGPVWETALSAPALGADNLTAIIDNNHYQSCGAVDEIIPSPNLRGAWENLGWNVLVVNGHCMEEVLSALESAYCYRGKPTCIIANTVKGKGVSYMEYDNAWHQKVPTKEQYEQAARELEEERACL